MSNNCFLLRLLLRFVAKKMRYKTLTSTNFMYTYECRVTQQIISVQILPFYALCDHIFSKLSSIRKQTIQKKIEIDADELSKLS